MILQNWMCGQILDMDVNIRETRQLALAVVTSTKYNRTVHDLGRQNLVETHGSVAKNKGSVRCELI